MDGRRVLALACAATILGNAPAAAGPTGLTYVPTTDVVPFHQLDVMLQNGNTTLDGRHAFFHDLTLVPQLEVGLPWNVEAGVDVTPADPPNDYRPAFNVKWRMLAEGDFRPAVAAGVAQLGPGFVPAGFAVAGKTLNYDLMRFYRWRWYRRNIHANGIRVHAGWLQVGRSAHAMLGADAELTDHFVVWADWISGAANALSLAGVFVLDRRTSFWVALLRQNDENRVSGVVFNVTHSVDW